MKTKREIFGVLIIITALWASELRAQGRNYSKELAKKEMSLTDFSSIEVSGLAQVYLSEGTETQARLEVSGMPMDEVSVVVEKEILKISTPSNYNGESVKIYITYKEIRKLFMTDATELFSKGPIETSKLEISCFDSANAVLELNVNLVEILMKDSADLSLTGYAKEQMVLSKSKNGTFDNSGLQSK